MINPGEKGLLAPEVERLLATESEKRKIQLGVLTRLLAYFDSVYEIFHVRRPSCHTPIVVWMTEDVDNPDNPFQGPIPLLFRLPQNYVICDYREANDERAGIIGKASGELNPKAAELLNSPMQKLENLIVQIDRRIEEIGDPRERPSIVKKLKRWEKETGYCRSPLVRESTRHDLGAALQDLYNYYTKTLRNSESKNF